MQDSAVRFVPRVPILTDFASSADLPLVVNSLTGGIYYVDATNTIQLSGLTHTTGALTANAVVLGNGAADITVLGSLGTTTTVLHGNAAGAPTFAAVSLTADISGILPVANGGTATATPSLVAGTNITSITGTWPNQTINAAASGGTNFGDALNTTAPNNTINAAVLSILTGTTSVDMVLSPKGASGAFIIGPAPDSTATGGSKRGTQAVDLQLKRSGASLVASGTNSGLFAGNGNSASQTNAVSLGGTSNAASAPQAATVGGSSLSASGADSVAMGNGSTASGAQSMAFGNACRADAVGSIALGYGATARAINGAFAHASNSAPGAQQSIHLVLRCTTSDAVTGKTPTSDGGAAMATNQWVLTSASAVMVEAKVIARNISTGNLAWWIVTGACKYVGGVVTLSGTPTVTAIAGDAAMNTCTVALVADNTNKCLSFTVNGIAATTINWIVEGWSAELA